MWNDLPTDVRVIVAAVAITLLMSVVGGAFTVAKCLVSQNDAYEKILVFVILE